MNTKELSPICRQVRRDIITMTANAGSGHPGGSLSAVELMTSVFFNHMRVDPKNPHDPDRDRFVLSKGHAAPCYYAVLAAKGFISRDEYANFRQLHSILQGHPDAKKVPGVDAATGSLGQGCSIAVGMALGMNGVFLEPSTGEVVDWKTHRTLAGLLLFIVIGIMAGMFGLGAGWANVPVLNLLMGVPLKVSVGTSKFLLSITDTSAAWVYLNQGCVIPLMAIPSIVGLMLGSVVGVRLLAKAKPKFIRIMVIAVLFFSGAKALLKGLGW